MLGLHLTADSDWEHIPAEVSHIRLWDCGVHWGAIHLGPGRYDWDKLDRLVNLANGRHLTYVLAGTPRWLALNPGQAGYAPWLGEGSNSQPADLAHWREFVHAVAARYKGRIHAYEVWNEPALREFWWPYNRSTLSTLAVMTTAAKDQIRRVDPVVPVLAASILPRPSSGGMKRSRLYLEALKSRHWPVDGMTVHIYPEPGKGWLRWHWMLMQTKATLRRMGAPRRLWVTESMFNLLGPEDQRIPAWMRRVQKSKANVWWYAYNRPDLKGNLIKEHTPVWDALKETA